MKGKCTYGDRCKFLHTATVEGQKQEQIGRKICRHFAKGNCELGGKCTFLHEKAVPTIICQHFEKGQCFKGANCTFLHVKDPKPFIGVDCKICEYPLIDPETGVVDAEDTRACDHHFHAECLRNYMLVKINDGITDIGCPAGCKATTVKKNGKLRHEDFKRILSPADFEKWETRTAM